MSKKTQMAALGLGLAAVAGLGLFVLATGDGPPPHGLGARPSPTGADAGSAGSPTPPVSAEPAADASPAGSPTPPRPSPPDPERDPVPSPGDAREPRASRSPEETAEPGEGPVAVRFVCRDGGGEPLSGVRIEAERESGAPLEPVVSDARGRAAIEGLPTGGRIEGVGHHPRARLGQSFGPLRVDERTVVRMTFERSEQGRLLGRIVSDRGEPLRRGAELLLKDPRQDGEKVLGGVDMGLGPDGRFQATVAAGRYAVTARGEGFSRSNTSYVTVPADGEADAGELVVYRQGTLAGTLSLPPDLQSVLPVELDLVMEVTRGDEDNPYQHTRRRPLQVDAGFSFAVRGCDPGDYRIRLERPRAGGNRVGPWVEVTLEPGQRLDGIELSLQEVAVSIRGVVRDDRGDPVPGATVSVRGRTATTDRDGRYALRGLDAGDLGIEVQAEGYGDAFAQVSYDGSERTHDVTLERSGGVRGRVEGPDGPAGGVPVQVVQRSDGGIVRPHQVMTEPDGSFLLEDLPPGSYYIKAGRGADPFDDSGATPVQVRPGEVADASVVRLR